MTTGLYVELNIICIFILFISITKLTTVPDLRKQHRFFAVALIMNIALYIFDSLWILIENEVFSTTNAINYVVNMAYFIFTALIFFFWFIYCYTFEKKSSARSNLIIGFMSIPALILIVSTLFTPLTKWIFYIDEQNCYHKGELYFIQIAVTLFYMISASVCSLFNAFNKSMILYRQLFISCALFTLFSGASIFLQISFPGYPINCVGFTVPILLIILKISELGVDVDELTLLYNRNWLYRNSHRILKQFNDSPDTFTNNIYVILMDIDTFSEINHRMGKEIGNRMLLQLTDILNELPHEVGGHSSLIPIRYDEDAFVIIASLESSKEISLVTDMINMKLHQLADPKINGFKFTVSYGFSELDNQNPYFYDAIVLADLQMYKEQKSKGTHI